MKISQVLVPYNGVQNTNVNIKCYLFIESRRSLEPENDFWQNRSFVAYLSLLDFSEFHSVHKKGWQWCWWHRYVGDIMMVTDFICWWQNHYVGDFFRYVGEFLNVFNRSSTSWIGRQHLKLVTNTFGLQHPSPPSM